MSEADISRGGPPRPLATVMRDHADALRGNMVAGASLATIAGVLDRAARRLDILNDVRAVQLFAALMTTRTMQTDHDRWRGWHTLPSAHLWSMLRESVARGEPVEIAMLAMMVQQVSETERRAADERADA